MPDFRRKDSWARVVARDGSGMRVSEELWPVAGSEIGTSEGSRSGEEVDCSRGGS